MEAQQRKTISATFSRPIAPRSEIQDSLKFVQPPPKYWEALKTRMKPFLRSLFLIIGNKIYRRSRAGVPEPDCVVTRARRYHLAVR
jgi:hypothetical protein